MKKDFGRNIFQKYIKKSVMLKYALWSETRYIQQNVWNSEKILTVRLNRSESCENFWKPQQLSGTCHCQTAQSKIDDVVKTFEIILETPYYLDVVKPPGCDTIPNYWKKSLSQKAEFARENYRRHRPSIWQTIYTWEMKIILLPCVGSPIVIVEALYTRGDCWQL